MLDFLTELRTMLGTPAQIGTFLILLAVAIKTYPIIQKNVLEARAGRDGRYGARIQHLESELTRCHEECSEKIEKLDNKIQGMRDQRAAEQIAMMRAILRTVEDPNLRKQLEMLEALHMTVNPAFVGGPVADKLEKEE